MENGKLWHKQRSPGRRLTFQEETTQLVVPISERSDVMDLSYKKALAHGGFDKTYLAVGRVYFWQSVQYVQDVKRLHTDLSGLSDGKKLPQVQGVLKAIIGASRF